MFQFLSRRPLLSGIVRPAVRGAVEDRPPGTPGVATPPPATRAARLLLSPIWPPHISHPSTSPSAPRLSACPQQPLTLQCSQVWMAVAERAKRVPCGPQETVKTCRTRTVRRTAHVLFLLRTKAGLIWADFYLNVFFSPL